MAKTETVLVVGAHADDSEISMGGTIAKYAKEGKRMINVICTEGDASSPWLKKEYLVAQRKAEVEAIEEFIGFSKTYFLGLPDTKVSFLCDEAKYKKKLEKIILKHKPTKIFTHSKFDPHKDHQGTNKLVFNVLKKIDPKKKIQVYVFEVWNITNETRPGMYVDVTKTFSKKIKAIKMFKSQWLSVYVLLIPIYYKAFISGLHNSCRYAERFYKIR